MRGGGWRGGEPPTARLVPAASTPPAWSKPLLADRVFAEELTLDDYGGRGYEFELDGSWTHLGDCTEAGRNKATEKYLSGCETRVEATYEGDGFRVSFQVLAFPRDKLVTWAEVEDVPDDFEPRRADPWVRPSWFQLAPTT